MAEFWINFKGQFIHIKAFGADIFFDDQDAHLEHISKETPSAKVPYKR